MIRGDTSIFTKAKVSREEENHYYLSLGYQSYTYNIDVCGG